MTKVINRDTVYENTQGVLSMLALTFGALGFVGAADFYFLKSEADLSAFGAEFYPALIATGLSVFAVTMSIKLVGALVHNHFWLRIEFANKLTALAQKIDPRRK